MIEGLLNPKLIRFTVAVRRRKTSVSMDKMLADIIQERLGDEKPIVTWVEEQAQRFDDLIDADGKRGKIGLSRLIQREGVLLVAGKSLPQQPKADGEERD